MTEIVFSESAGGSLKQARHWGEGTFPGGFGVVFSPNTEASSPGALRRGKKQAEQRARQAWAEAVPMGDALGEVCPLPLALSTGEIARGAFDPGRAAVLTALAAELSPPPGRAAGQLERARERLLTVLERAGNGEALRIWHSGLPDDQCGLRWLLSELCRLERLGPIRTVELPPYSLMPDGSAVRHEGWEGVRPGEWASFLPLQRALPARRCTELAQEWRVLQAENAPLRAVVSGQLVSVEADFYDSFLLRELAAQPQTFHQAAYIGTILRKYRFGLSDGWVAWRMEQWIRAGLLEPVPAAAEEDQGLIYHRHLRKRSPQATCC